MRLRKGVISLKYKLQYLRWRH